MLRLGLAYSAIVFAVGFALGTVRTLWLVPRLGQRWAELAEMPVMVGASWLAAQGLFARSGLSRWAAAGAGLLALTLLAGVEVAVVLRLRGLSWGEYVASRDPVSGSVYLAALLLFALLPVLVVSFAGRGRP
ncbi:MAG: hypothetical protein R2991_06985 [Thermoanaerobaculia bacterium]